MSQVRASLRALEEANDALIIKIRRHLLGWSLHVMVALCILVRALYRGTSSSTTIVFFLTTEI